MYFCLFFLLIRQPQRSKLFPYTTHFRSPVAAAVGVDERPVGRRLAPPRRRAVHHVVVEEGEGVQQLEGDRKSTRLNSSHANISYAVFCLKKKNTVMLHTNHMLLLSIQLY